MVLGGYLLDDEDLEFVQCGWRQPAGGSGEGAFSGGGPAGTAAASSLQALGPWQATVPKSRVWPTRL